MRIPKSELRKAHPLLQLYLAQVLGADDVHALVDGKGDVDLPWPTPRSRDKLRIDRLDQRVERIERRLDMHEEGG